MPRSLLTYLCALTFSITSSAALAATGDASSPTTAASAADSGAATSIDTTTPSPPVATTVAELEQQWAIIHYQMTDHDQQEQAVNKLSHAATLIAKNNPTKAEPLIWQAMILTTKADIDSNFGSLLQIQRARDLLLQSIKLNPKAAHGLASSLLGSLYYQAPSPPLSFGDNDLAKEYLEKGLALNPNGLEANYFYGDYLVEQGDQAKAKTVLKHALAAPPLANDVEDKGRRAEIKESLDKIDSE